MAKQSSLDAIKARNRRAKAELDWKHYRDTVQFAHPELPNLRFTSDFRFAFITRQDPNSFPADGMLSTASLSAEQQRQGTSAFQEMEESRKDLSSAERRWRDLQNQLVMQHIPSAQSGVVFQLPGDKRYIMPDVWQGGIAFTPYFHLGVPAH